MIELDDRKISFLTLEMTPESIFNMQNAVWDFYQSNITAFINLDFENSKDSVRPPQISAEGVNFDTLPAPFTELPDFTNRCMRGIISSARLLSLVSKDISYPEMLSGILHQKETEACPSLYWLHFMCAFRNPGLRPQLYDKASARGIQVLKLVTEFLYSISRVTESNEELWLSPNSITSTDFFLKFKKLVHPTSPVNNLWGSKAQEEKFYDSWYKTWLNGIFGLMAVMGLAELGYDAERRSFSKFSYVRPTELLTQIVTGDFSNKKTLRQTDPAASVVFDDNHLIARFTDAHVRGVLVRAGGELISTNRVAFSLPGLAKASSKTPLKVIKNRLCSYAKIDDLPEIWNQLFDQIENFRNSIHETSEYLTFRVSTESDMKKLRDAIKHREHWTQFILFTESDLIMVNRRYINLIQDNLLNYGILLGNN